LRAEDSAGPARFTDLEVAGLREATPGTRSVVHLDNAGAALMPAVVISAVQGYLDSEIHRGGYRAADERKGEIDATYQHLAHLIGADPTEIALADNATRAWDIAFYGLDLGDGDRILTTTTEYVSNWAAYLHLRATTGVEVTVVPDTSDGEIDVEALEDMIDGRVKLISLNHVPTHASVVQPAAAVGRIASEHGIPYLLDACQSVGHLPVDVATIGCDLLSATSRKFLRGPRGAGFLFVRSDFIDRVAPSFVETGSAVEVRPDRYELHPDARRYETWEKNYAAVVGVAAAAGYASELGIDRIWDRIQRLADHARLVLSETPGVTVHDTGRVKGGIVTFSLEGVPARRVQRALQERAINVSVSTRASAPVDMYGRGIDELVRSSYHAYNTHDEIDRLAHALRSL
jgi:selenocysteine lyase/cysteine desulfurase